MNKNLRKKALVPAIAMVIASVIALSGVTYAWFTTGNTAKVETLDVNVQTANGIQVSLDATSWKSTISGADIQEAISGSTQIQYPIGEIAPVSTAGAIEDGKLQMFLGEYNKDGTLKSVVADESNRTSGGNFVAFDLYFKSSTEQTLTLKLGDTQSFVKGIDMTKEGKPATNIGTEKAVRVAFIPIGNAATPAEARGLKADADSDVLIWEPNSGTRAAGIEGTGKLDYKGFNTTFEAVAEDNLGDNVTAVTTFDSDYDIIKLKSGINKVRVYIWLEGQDVDCVNTISFGDFTVSLAFAVPEV